ncbi:hypothetical protein B0E43_02010 [Algoriphagus sp. A40]|nr:hypothetical protein B0E43_02010 [Algoriphagus sp. A40]
MGGLSGCLAVTLYLLALQKYLGTSHTANRGPFTPANGGQFDRILLFIYWNFKNKAKSEAFGSKNSEYHNAVILSIPEIYITSGERNNFYFSAHQIAHWKYTSFLMFFGLPQK